MRKSSLCGAAGCGLHFLGQFIFGSFSGILRLSDRPHIGNDVSPVFSKFLSDVVRLFCVAGVIFGEVGG